MAGTGGRRGPLVADKRYPSKAAAKPKAKSAPTRKAKPPRKPRSPRPRGPISGFILGLFSLIWRIIWGFTWRSGAVVVLILGLATFYFYAQLPDYTALLDGRNRGSVTLLDENGKVFAWRGETFGGQTTAGSVSPFLKNAVVATEDRRFYRHFGVSPRGIASAIKINLSEGRGPLSGNGGSTITQQVAKLLCLGVPYDQKQWKTEAEYENDCRSGGITRKIKEIPYALAMEVKYSKDEILTIYLNRAYLGAGARGFEAAAQRYFGISAANVNAQQAAMLAGLLKAPSTYAPTTNLKRSQERAGMVLALMHDQGFLTDAEWQKARANPATLSEAAQARAGGYFADWVMDSIPDFLSKDTTEDVVIRTTLDQRIQTAAEEALKEIFETKVRAGSTAEAAIVVMSADGAVRAMVGGRASKVSGAFNRATQARRQTGSTFKPFVYAVALDMGWTPDTIVEDAPLTISVPGSGPWTPKNYGGGYLGPIPLWMALAKSINTATVRVGQAVGFDAVRRAATDFGFASKLAEGPAVVLGVSESTLLEMTGAFAGILNGGSSVRPYGLTDLRLRGDKEPLFGAGGGMGERVISEKAARELIWMMHQGVEQGTGQRAKLEGREAAGKTGTTQAARDAWFIGFTADYVAGVWMGYDNNKPLTGVTGGGLPADIWHAVMTRVEAGQPVTPLPMADPAEWRGQPDPYAGSNAYPGQVWSSGDPIPEGGVPVVNGQLIRPGGPAPEPQRPQSLGEAIDSLLRQLY
ncbi:penicillin-binding protein 1A [Rhodobacter aestuarii]|uniref:peptidoglycan glycosyltransferase n=1 Tax=Rhodobacter aestuarii TaxID=453582 RepID=A0A1N7LS62_9RHOB|nr:MULTISPECIES: PBP1A family penicillin-binding protein [Rhodobacter]PTV95068.1 penicillin-binding protein 1A [Rhodobacter aestuarii]SIS76612.1 penicillin-binding protein 1A [Rhodobacter aestuarii]SOC07193.1 penicillin-binding protein 1A [Rhodobacter sp. JA431]